MGSWTNPNKRFYSTGAYEIHKSVNRSATSAATRATSATSKHGRPGSSGRSASSTTVNGIYEELSRNIAAGAAVPERAPAQRLLARADATARQEQQRQLRLGARQRDAGRSAAAQHAARGRESRQRGEPVHVRVQAQSRPPLLVVRRLRAHARIIRTRTTTWARAVAVSRRTVTTVRRSRRSTRPWTRRSAASDRTATRAAGSRASPAA